jgi:hypothetical protein
MIGHETIAQPRPRSARQRIADSGQTVNTAPNVDMPRFFVQMGWDKLEVDTEAIPGKQLLRGEITPCRSHKQKSNIHEIQEGQRIPGMDEIDRASGDNRVIWGYYWKRAQDEGERLKDIERTTDPTRRMGLVEIASLAGIRSVYYDQFDFNEIFYPNGLDALPIKNADLKAHIESRVAAINDLALPPELKPVLLELGRELITACDVAESIQSNRIEFTHRCMQLSPDDKSGYYKKGYDEPDEEMLLRTGKPRVGEALEVQAKALHILAEDKAAGRHDDPFAGLAKAMEDQNTILREQLTSQAEQNRQLMQMLMARPDAKPQADDAPLDVSLPSSKKK